MYPAQISITQENNVAVFLRNSDKGIIAKNLQHSRFFEGKAIRIPQKDGVLL